MKAKFLFLMLITFAASEIGYSKTYTITSASSGFSFSPNTLTINAGDTVIFSLASIHTAVEVDQSTWDADGVTSNGGFNLPLGGGTVVLTQAGVHYYVCSVHAGCCGMKGTITVNAASGVEANETSPERFILMQNYPNPFNPSTIIRYGLPLESKVSIKIFDLTGKEIEELSNNIESAGYHQVIFNGAELASGIYFYRISAVTADGKINYSDTKKLILLK